MKNMTLASTAMLALAGCTTGQPYGGVEAGPTTVAEVAAPPVAPVPVPVPSNPMLAAWAGPYGGVPAWDQYNPSQFGEAFTYAIEAQRRDIAAIVNNPAPATFD